uniref:Uncharacterized protein n=1 Tax=uncultured Elusimicrobia bacterium TaxID=699876 RepID=A0A650ELY1_9BACT|nr:hypothetical protein Elusimicrob1349_2000 [uncultured Elusimicrobia bacterium]
MKIVTLLSILFLSSAVFAQTYRSGGTRKANFGAQQTQGENSDDKKSSVPGANSAVKTRTFTSYGARQQWGKGVQTKTVQTSTAGTAAPQEPAEETMVPGAEKKVGSAVAKKGASAPKAAPAAGAVKPGEQAQAQQQPAMPAEAAAAMQQVQGLQDMLKNLGGAAGAGSAGAAPANAPAGAAAGMPAGMNIPGMPDMSALMGAAAAGQQPGKK